MQITLFLLLIQVACTEGGGGIRPFEKQPYYWEYRGHPVMLLGASDDDNLFQMTGLHHHLLEMKACGANYVRNTMSSRPASDSAIAQPFKRTEDGQYDLDAFNPTYWNRLDSLLAWTHALGIFVQVELWATHDLFGKDWHVSPWNPANNGNYTAEEVTVDPIAPGRAYRYHPFFNTVPGAAADTILLQYQRSFAEKVLEHTLRFDHVLYCITNEIQPAQTPRWGEYWSQLVRQRAGIAGRKVMITEMYWTPDMQSEQQREALEDSRGFDFFESSQNSALSGEQNWENLRYLVEALSGQPRPVNSVKVYGKSHPEVTWPGSDDEGIDRFWRNILGGCASARFHREEEGMYGLGLSDKSKESVRTARWFTSELPPWTASPCMDLFIDRDSNEVYGVSGDGGRYGLYFPDEADIMMELRENPAEVELQWRNAVSGSQLEELLKGGAPVRIETPPGRHWVCLLKQTGDVSYEGK